MLEPNKGKRQEVRLMNRKFMEITGVLNVESFDNEQFLLETDCGFLMINGSGLHIKNLNLEQGMVAIEGLVNGMEYLEANSHGKSKGFLGKLFK